MANTLKFGNGEWYGKKDTILAYNDENNNYKPLPFDFSRGSSATVVNKDGLIETVGSGEPRVDYKDNSKGALLLEPSRSNLFTNSEDFLTNWSRSNVEIDVNQITSLNGTINADFIRENESSNPHFTFQTVGATTTSKYTVSVFAKYHSRFLQMFFGGGDVSGNPYVNFDLQNGTFNNVGADSVSMEEYNNGWYKCSVTATSSVTSGFNPIFGLVKSIGASRANSYTGDGTSGVYLWGAMLEQGSYATSYIPTQGGVVTRLADECEQTPPSGVVGQTELTIFYQGIVERLGGNDGHAITLSQSADGAGSSRVLLYRNSSNGNMYVYVQDTTTQFSTPLLANSNPQINDKYAIAIKDNDLVVYCNGVKVSENNSGTIPATQYLILNKWNNQINQQNKTKEVKLYNTRLSNSELQALTSN